MSTYMHARIQVHSCVDACIHACTERKYETHASIHACMGVNALFHASTHGGGHGGEHNSCSAPRVVFIQSACSVEWSIYYGVEWSAEWRVCTPECRVQNTEFAYVHPAAYVAVRESWRQRAYICMRAYKCNMSAFVYECVNT